MGRYAEVAEIFARQIAAQLARRKVLADQGQNVVPLFTKREQDEFEQKLREADKRIKKD